MVYEKEINKLEKYLKIEKDYYQKIKLMDALRYLCMGLPFDFKECYNTSKPIIIETKDTLINRLKPDTDISSFLGTNEGGAYGLGMYNMN